MAFRIEQKKADCIGCGACAAVDPADWKLEGDKAELIGSKKEKDLYVKIVKEIGANQDAADSCPVKCIAIKKI
ncbi:MAG: ferredoxin [Candidatus Diapherotrites archaeon]|nr:ferredoxin [Candidatus Diapherotrites archaeon]